MTFKLAIILICLTVLAGGVLTLLINLAMNRTNNFASAKVGNASAKVGYNNNNNNNNNNKDNNKDNNENNTPLKSPQGESKRLEKQFDEFWKLYPKKQGKKTAEREYIPCVPYTEYICDACGRRPKQPNSMLCKDCEEKTK